MASPAISPVAGISRLPAAWPFDGSLKSGSRNDFLRGAALVLMALDHANYIGLMNHPVIWAFGRSVFPLFALLFAFHIRGNPDVLMRSGLKLLMWGLAAQPVYVLALSSGTGAPIPWHDGNILFVFAGASILRSLQMSGRSSHAAMVAVATCLVTEGGSGGAAATGMVFGATLAFNGVGAERLLGPLLWWSCWALIPGFPSALPLLPGALTLAIVLAAFRAPIFSGSSRILPGWLGLSLYPGHLAVLLMLSMTPHLF